MKFVKYLAVGVVGLVVVVLLIGFALPSSFHVERSIVIAAPPQQVYQEIVDLRRWRQWGVWFTRDPDMQLSYSGPEAAVGMKSVWISEQEGSGEMTITALEPNQKVVYDLFFPDFDMGSTGEFQLEPTDEGTRVVWMDYGDVGGNPLLHYFAVMMDSMIGPDFETGLSNLKTLVENQV